MSDFPKMCRLCLQEEQDGTDERLYDVFSFEPKQDLSRKIANCTGVLVTPEDPIPSLICTTCIITVEKFDDFLEKVRNSDMFLTSIYYRNELDEDNEKNNCETNNGNEESDDKSNKNKTESDEYISCDSSSTLNEHEVKSLNELPKPAVKKPSGIYFPGGQFVTIPDKDDDDEGNIEPPYSCSICNKSFDTFFNYQDHQATHNGQFVFCCSKCEEVFSTRDQLLEHEKNHKVPCKVCQTEMLPKSLSAHMLKHTDKFKCAECGAKFSSKAILERHTNALHMKIKGNVCHICGKQISCQSSMKRHMAFHSSNRPFKCKHCNFTAKSVSILQVHTKRKHTAQKCTCEICTKVFKSELSLQQHTKRIHDTKKHSCYVCGKAFSEKFNLTTHMQRRHAKQWFYECQVCNWEFLTVKELKQHMLTHRQNYSKCPKCDKQFAYRKQYEKHISSCTQKLKGGKYSLKNTASMPEASVHFKQ